MEQQASSENIFDLSSEDQAHIFHPLNILTIQQLMEFKITFV